MEEGNQSGHLAISGGHGNAQEKYAMRKRSFIEIVHHIRLKNSSTTMSLIISILLTVSLASSFFPPADSAQGSYVTDTELTDVSNNNSTN